MKIVSKFKDYYDTVSHQYLDKEVLYLRESVTHKLKDKPVIVGREHKYDKNSVSYHFYFEYIGFCGQVYPVLQVKWYEKNAIKESTIGLYTPEEVYGFFEYKGLTLDQNKYYWRYHHMNVLNERGIEEFFNERERRERLIPFFDKYQTPVFAYRRQDGNGDAEVEVNPQLKPYLFSRVKDPFTAHQDLYRYITSVMVKPDRPMVQLTDKDRIAKHGFDKWSFRKEKVKK
jgi:hypothetical protein